MPIRYFEDFEPGETVECGSRIVSKDEIIAFASVFDPQPMHVDEDAARHTFVGELIASGWHTISLVMRMIALNLLNDSTSMGAPGVDQVKWLKPLKPGDTLSTRYTILGVKASNSKPDRGFVTMRIEGVNQHGETVMEQTNPVMFRRRSAGEHAVAGSAIPPLPEDDWYGADGVLQSGFTPAGIGPDDALPAAQDLVIGERTELGTCHFSADDIIRFGRAFDPQPFHLDEAAGRASHFGGLVASGWQTAGCWMHLMFHNRERRSQAMAARGRTPPQLGPSPGFKTMRWLKAVHAGDTIAYSSTVLETRLSQSRPGWALVSHQNQGVNQKGELVFEFIGTVFWQA